MTEPSAAADAAPALPPGDYAIVEVLGHRVYVGRVEEVERFGSKLLSIEPLYCGALLAPVLVGGGSLYQFTPCTPEQAASRSPQHRWQLPASVAALLPPEALPAPGYGADDEDEGLPF